MAAIHDHSVLGSTLSMEFDAVEPADTAGDAGDRQPMPPHPAWRAQVCART